MILHRTVHDTPRLARATRGLVTVAAAIAAAGLALSTPASAYEFKGGWEPLEDLIPEWENGENGVWTQRRVSGTSDYVNMTNFGFKTWRSPGFSWNLPHFSITNTFNSLNVHPQAQNDSVMRIVLEGTDPEILVRGTAGGRLLPGQGRNGFIFRIYIGEDGWQNPVWEEDFRMGPTDKWEWRDFEIAVPYQPGDELFFAVDARGHDGTDHTFWWNVELFHSEVPDNTPPVVNCSGSGTYQAGLDAIVLDAAVSDLDGDTVEWTWFLGDPAAEQVLAAGSLPTLPDGEPVNLQPLVFDTVYGSSYYLGEHTFTLVVRDEHGGDTCAVHARVIDEVAPTLAPELPANCPLWPPNHAMELVCIDANAIDIAGAPVQLAAAVSSSEPQNADGDGNTEPDFGAPVIDGDRVCVELRRERQGSGQGRVYTIELVATDMAGNASAASVECRALHDRRTR